MGARDRTKPEASQVPDGRGAGGSRGRRGSRQEVQPPSPAKKSWGTTATQLSCPCCSRSNEDKRARNQGRRPGGPEGQVTPVDLDNPFTREFAICRGCYALAAPPSSNSATPPPAASEKRTDILVSEQSTGVLALALE
ncbi:hypothetical protein NDU88_003018 [Pleurodeles waltl]|uniref:Uncharacterized protein n=1 Tax=Pleurodeles waltl TaxID=8319 RepID=A0AAV7UBC7_PLEWA|nr:hypothetical protein NDU88_003018 [Pleurodeles waltl]